MPSIDSSLVDYSRTLLLGQVLTARDALNTRPVSIWEFVDSIVVKPDLNDFSTWDWKPAIDAALASSKRVEMTQRDSTLAYKTSPITVSRGDAELLIPASQNVIFTNVANDAFGLTLSGDSAKVYGGILRTDNPLSNIMRTTGFRNLVYDVKAGTGSEGGCKTALTVDGLETIQLLGRFRSGSSAGIQVLKPDFYTLNAYCESNRAGIRSDGVGSITAHHLHMFGNSVFGGYFAGASYSQLVSLYADTNGTNGIEIRDTSAGLTMIDCWSYKSSNASAGAYDFAFYNAKGVRMIGGNSSGAGAFTKAGSIRLQSDSAVNFIGTFAELPITSDNGAVALQKSTFTDCIGALRRYNRPQNRTVLGGQAIGAAGANAVFSISTPLRIADLTSPGNTMFQVRLLGRSTSGSGISIAGTFDVLIGFGGVALLVFPHYASDLAITVPTLTDNVDGTCQLAFTVTNNNALPMQVAAFVDYYGTSRGTG